MFLGKIELFRDLKNNYGDSGVFFCYGSQSIYIIVVSVCIFTRNEERSLQMLGERRVTM